MSTDPYIELAIVKKLKPRQITDAVLDKRHYFFQFRHIAKCYCSVSKGHLYRENCFDSCALRNSLSCSKAHKWCHIAGVPPDSEALYLELLKRPLNSQKYATHLDQIEIDLMRTIPDNVYFCNGIGKEALKRVLCAVTKYNLKLGYVQGMNFIAASLLHHTCESQAFWLMLILLEKYKLKDNFKARLPGLMKHCFVIDFLLEQRLPNLSRHFKNLDVSSPMFITDWCLTLFCRQVPLHTNYKLIGNFFKQGWEFFYKLVLLILKRLESRLLSEDSREGILSLLKPFQPTDWKEFMKLLTTRWEKLSWRKLAKLAMNENIDMQQINDLLQRPESSTEKY